MRLAHSHTRSNLDRGIAQTSLLAATLLAVGGHTAAGTVRARAAFEFGCSESDVSVTNVSGLTYSATGCGREAIYTCAKSMQASATNEIVCISDNIPGSDTDHERPTPATEEAKPKSVDSKIEAPTGAAGFEFGITEAEAEAVCTKAGHTWTKLDKKHGECSGSPLALSMALVPRLRFCSSKLCVIQLDTGADREAELPSSVLSNTYQALRAKYGPKTAGTMTISPACQNGGLRPCIGDDSVSVDVSWHWSTGEGITLFTGESRIGPKQESPSLFLYYSSSRRQFQTQGL